MYRHLLVPLDGSKSAEAALPAAVYLARTIRARLTLLHVLERSAPEKVHGERHLASAAEAQAYLDELEPGVVGVERHVHTVGVGDVARSLVDHARELGVDLIVMCTHGRSGPREWVWGSLAQQVLALDATPVLLIRPSAGEASPEFHCRRLLVPLDGAPSHEAGLRAAAALAEACGSDLHLLVVIPTPGSLSGDAAVAGRLLPGTMSAVLDLAEEGGRQYLRRLMDQVRPGGRGVAGEVRRGEPAAEIAEAALAVQADLIVLATHSRAGMEAFWSGSVAPRVSGRTRVPLLLVPVRD